MGNTVVDTVILATGDVVVVVIVLVDITVMGEVVDDETAPLWNKSRRSGPPQFSDASPLHGISQPFEPSKAGAPPFLIL